MVCRNPNEPVMLPIKALPPPPPLSRATTSGTTQNQGAVRHHNQSSALEAAGGRRSRPMGGRRRADLTSGRRALTWSTGSRSPAQRHTGPRLRPSSKRPETGGGWVSLDTSPGRGGGQRSRPRSPVRREEALNSTGIYICVLGLQDISAMYDISI